MMFKDLVVIKPYYVVPKKLQHNSTTETRTEGMKDIIALPDYKIEVPSKKLIKCLELINNHDSGKLSKKKLKDMLNSLI
ncbi:MAG TPA: DUF6293 family protein [Nitrososphaeraceae archaeon]|jgi:hypothetical protein|nr:DUF6293 family protein [Nitrososphaeraceae archaeon]